MADSEVNMWQKDTSVTPQSKKRRQATSYKMEAPQIQGLTEKKKQCSKDAVSTEFQNKILLINMLHVPMFLHLRGLNDEIVETEILVSEYYMYFTIETRYRDLKKTFTFLKTFSE